MALPNPFQKSTAARTALRSGKAAAAAKDALAAVRANASKKIEAVTEASKKQLAKFRTSAHGLAIKAKEPVLGIVHDEGVRMAGHASGFGLDYFVPYRGAKSGVLNVLARPSMGLAIIGFAIAGVTKGETRFYARSAGQGALHQVEAVALRAIARAWGGNADGAMGEGEGEPGDADV